MLIFRFLVSSEINTKNPSKYNNQKCYYEIYYKDLAFRYPVVKQNIRKFLI